jgi:hypothetical protein
MNDTPEQNDEAYGAAVVTRLQRELQHVNEQLRVEHAMTLDWKARALVAERQLERAQKIADRAQQPKDAPAPRRANAVHAPADLLENEP